MDKQKQLNKFKIYLEQGQGYKRKTVLTYRSTAALYLDWAIDNELEVKRVTLNQLYSYIALRRKKGDCHKTIVRLKSILTHFYYSLSSKNNPALLLEFAKEDRPTPTNLLDEEFLENIYRETITNTLTQKRDKCILGMIVFLGLQRAELREIELRHLELEEGRIYIPATQRTNERYCYLLGIPKF